ncbi:MAG: sortase, partial [Chloroflexi bacterium]|nr:sortase [Chloroflexota bacterium]
PNEDDYAAASITYQPEADLELSKSVDPTTAGPGDTVTFTVTVTNRGPNDATGVEVTDILPSGLQNAEYSTDGGATWARWTGQYTLSALPAGDSFPLRLRAVVAADAAASLTNTAAVQAATPDPVPDNNQARATLTTRYTHVFDPPAGWKTVDEAGWPTLAWRLVWINNGNTAALQVFLTDPIPAGTTYVDGSLVCVPHGDTTVASCRFNPAANRIEVVANLAADPAATGEADAAHPLVVTFRTTVAAGETYVENQGRAYWDENGDGQVDARDANLAHETPVLTDDPRDPEIGDPTEVRMQLPETGFPPARVSWLPPAPHPNPYDDLGALWLDIPRLGVREPIVGVSRGADLSWLMGVGWLDTTAFPGAQGRSVLTGHNWLPTGLPGPFAHLAQLRWDDVVRVHLDGTVYEYRVRQVVYVAPDATWPLTPIQDGYAWLTLITCARWDEASGQYRARVVVQAVLTRVYAQPGP